MSQNQVKRLLLVGPLPDPISGVSLANKVVKTILEEDPCFKVSSLNTSFPLLDENLGTFSFRKFFFFVKLNLKCLRIIPHDIIYMTPGQTYLGILKYAPYIFIGWLLRKEMIIHVHGNYLGQQYHELTGLKKHLFFFFVSRFTKGIVLSESLAHNLLPFLNKDVIYSLPNFAETYLLTSSKKDFNSLNLVYLSNLMEEKGIHVFLEALKLLEAHQIPYTAKIAGAIDPTHKNRLLTRINALVNTEYVGIVTGDDKKNLLFWSTIFVLPTFYKMEGQPIAILEALATRNVIITTDHAGISDIISNKEHGYFIRKQNVTDLFQKLSELNADIATIERIAENNGRYFKNNFSFDIFKTNFLKILNAKHGPKPQ